MESSEGVLDVYQTELCNENTTCTTVVEGGGSCSGAHGPRSGETGSEFSSIPSLPPKHSFAPCREIQAPLSFTTWLHQHLAAQLWPGEAQGKSSQGGNQECPPTLGPIRLVEGLLSTEKWAWRSLAGNAECRGQCGGSEPGTPDLGLRKDRNMRSLVSGEWEPIGGSRRARQGA